MTRTEVQDRVMEALASVAPELASARLDPDLPLRDQVDLDSMDFLRFVVELHKRLRIDVPEADYQKLSSVRAIVDYASEAANTAGAAREPGHDR